MPEPETDAQHLLTILAKMQAEINELTDDKGKLEHELKIVTGVLNSHRLMMFPRGNGADYLTNCSRVDVSIVDMIAEDPTLETLSQFHKMHLWYTSRAAELIDKHKSDKIVKIARAEKHASAMKEVEEIRKAPKTKAAKLKLNTLDKALMGLRKTFSMLDDKAFVAMVKVTPAYSTIPDEDIQASIDKTKQK